VQFSSPACVRLFVGGGRDRDVLIFSLRLLQTLFLDTGKKRASYSELRQIEP